jgi:hypothetical protein
MSSRGNALLAALAAASIAALAPTTRASAASPEAQLGSALQTEISAVRKKARRKAVVVDSRSPYYLRPGVRPSFGYVGPPGYAGEYAWRKSIGQCVEDLGYGRWAPCGHR